MQFKKCKHCNAVINVMNENSLKNCDLTCCNEKMEPIIPNSEECAVEKHLPTYQIKNDKLIVQVNHVMEEEHFISFIGLVTEDKEFIASLNKKDSPIVEFPYEKGAIIYAYCNKHGLWKTKVS